MTETWRVSFVGSLEHSLGYGSWGFFAHAVADFFKSFIYQWLQHALSCFGFFAARLLSLRLLCGHFAIVTAVSVA